MKLKVQYCNLFNDDVIATDVVENPSKYIIPRQEECVVINGVFYRVHKVAHVFDTDKAERDRNVNINIFLKKEN